MKKPFFTAALWGIFFLFLVQMMGTLVESIYILDLMNTSLDEKALGLLFFFAPVLLYSYRDKRPNLIAWILYGIFFLARGLTPYLNTLGRMLASGGGTGAGLSLLPFLLTSRRSGEPEPPSGLLVSSGLALGVGLSVFLRTVNFGLDYSLFPSGGWVGWSLGVLQGVLLTRQDWGGPHRPRRGARPVTLAVTGIFLCLGLAWFAFSAPSVITRWTEGDYRVIVILISVLSLSVASISLFRPGWFERISPTWLLVWNLAFTGSLIWTLLSHRVPFPAAPSSPAVVVDSPSLIQHLPMYMLTLLFPVMFLDLGVFAKRIQNAKPTPRDLVPGTLLGSLILVLAVFMHIFTNVWGYVAPVSSWFRNKFWLPYLIMALLAALLVGRKGFKSTDEGGRIRSDFSWTGGAALGLLFLGTVLSVVLTTRIHPFEPRDQAIVAMTYNIQGANSHLGERSAEEQLALIREVGPDVLALQESDTARVSLNNHDVVRYYAGKLGYDSYYGPTTTSGTFGTAILSRFPLENTRTIFTFSDQDEVGTAAAEITVDGVRFVIFNVHPDGSDTAMEVFAETLLDRSSGYPNVIALGDFNLRDDEEAYQRISSRYTNAWISVYPTGVSPDGVDMSGENRIDHIFFSTNLAARDPVYLLPPDSATDHPVHWSTIVWEP